MIGQFRVVASAMRYIVGDLRQIPEEHLGMHYTLQRALTVHPRHREWLAATENDQLRKVSKIAKILEGAPATQVTAEI